MTVRLEHANLCVSDVEAMVQFLQTAFPEFRVRGDGTGADGSRWLHIGTDETYIALFEAKADAPRSRQPYAGEPGVNHLGYEVGDVDALHTRLKKGGYRESTVPNAHPHRKRVYFYDPEGNDWEFVQYYTDNPAERHDYALPDA